jgi:outer membrane protein assembly factor BamD
LRHPRSLLTRFSLVAVLFVVAGCSLFRPGPTPIPPPDELYSLGEMELNRRRYEEARSQFKQIIERHPGSSYTPRARFLIGEAFFREGEFDKAIKEFSDFLAFYPRHQIADLAQYRLAMSYYDQLKPIEQDQGLTVKALEQFKKLVKEYPESRYAADGLAKIDICRGRIAQKELFIANYYYRLGNVVAARMRLEGILKDYPRTLVVPETLYLLAEVNLREARTAEGTELLRRLANDYSYSEWGRRATQRLSAQR